MDILVINVDKSTDKLEVHIFEGLKKAELYCNVNKLILHTLKSK